MSAGVRVSSCILLKVTSFDLEMLGIVARLNGSMKEVRQLWTLCKSQRDRTCGKCRERYTKGAMVYRPITNAGNRYERLHKQCVLTSFYLSGEPV